MKIVYFGSSEFSVPFLKKIIGSRHDIIAVFTSADKKKGRGRKLAPNPVKEAAAGEGIKVFEINDIKKDLVDGLSGIDFDYAIVISFGMILPREVFEKWPGKWLNLHPSMLPEYRGPSPMVTALLDGAEQTGVTINDVVFEVDTGKIYAQAKFDIEPSDNLDSLEKKVIHFGGPLLIDVLDKIEATGYQAVPQGDEGISYTRKIEKDDLLIDWEKAGKEIVNKIRAFSSRPGAYGILGGERIKILRASAVCSTGDETLTENGMEPGGTIIAAGVQEGLMVRCGDGLVINIETLQPPGKKPMDHISFINGYHPVVGARFGNK